MIQQAAVLGAGSWGTALSLALADRGVEVTLYGNDPVVRDDINGNRRNSKYLPEIDLPDGIAATVDMADVADKPLILLVVPSQAARVVLTQLSEVGVPKDSIILSCTKGIDRQNGQLMHQLIGEIFPENPVAVLSGPSHAEEVARRMATLVTIGSEDPAVAGRIQNVFTLPWFRAYTNQDVIGIEVGSVLKNVFAIAAGAADGLGLGDNVKAAMVTRGLAEMTRLGVAMGAKEETFRGLSGIGDLIVTCYSKHGRNNRFGRMLGEGMSPEEALAAMDQVAEGVPNARNAYELARKLGVRTPLIDEGYAVLHEGKPTAEALRQLLERNPRSEVD
ncbi:MAG: NAD(P)H-dependent glycerol-3-phosphate dehydrogenase [Verrucomicrobiales bacterium]